MEDDLPRRFPVPLPHPLQLLLPLSPLSLPPRCDRWEEEVEVEDDFDRDLRRLVVVSVGDPRPALRLEVLLDRDLDSDLRLLVLETDGDLEDLDREVGPMALVSDWECDRE